MPGEALSVGTGPLLRTMGVEAMTLCAGCNYPIPSWQHNGACKPVADKVPPILDADWAERIVTAKRARRVTEIRTETVTNPLGGRPRVTNPSAAALRQREARAKKRQ